MDTQLKRIKNLKEAKKKILNSVDILISEKENIKYLDLIKDLNSLINMEEQKFNEMKKGGHYYEFYFRYKKEGSEYSVKIQKCKKPKMTLVYKDLEQNFNCGFIESYGFRLV